MTEYLRVANCHVRQDLPVEIDPREAERGHEATVRDAGVASRRVDPGDPEGAELTLPRAAGATAADTFTIGGLKVLRFGGPGCRKSASTDRGSCVERKSGS